MFLPKQEGELLLCIVTISLLQVNHFAVEIKEKEDKEVAIQLALQEKRKAKQEEAHRKKLEKEGKQIGNMVKKWIKEMEKAK